jgi:hypothetical protein
MGGVADMTREVVEFDGLPVGVAVTENGEVRFMAVKYHVIGLDGRRFRDVSEIKAAIRAHSETWMPIAA